MGRITAAFPPLVSNMRQSFSACYNAFLSSTTTICNCNVLYDRIASSIQPISYVLRQLSCLFAFRLDRNRGTYGSHRGVRSQRNEASLVLFRRWEHRVPGERACSLSPTHTSDKPLIARSKIHYTMCIATSSLETRPTSVPSSKDAPQVSLACYLA